LGSGPLFDTVSTALSNNNQPSGTISTSFFGSLFMTEPWDRPPYPSQGDTAEDITFAGVGRVISQWESIESELSHLYALFTGTQFKYESYEASYATGKTTQGRLQTAEKAADKFFQRKPHQKFEGEFCRLIKIISGFSERRHDVAHGIVQPFQWYLTIVPKHNLKFDTPFQFCVVPPHYQVKSITTKNLPKYIYTSVELMELEKKLYNLLVELILFKSNLGGWLQSLP